MPYQPAAPGQNVARGDIWKKEMSFNPAYGKHDTNA